VVAAEQRARAIVQARQVDLADDDLTGGGRIDARDQIQQRALAAAAAPPTTATNSPRAKATLTPSKHHAGQPGLVKNLPNFCESNVVNVHFRCSYVLWVFSILPQTTNALPLDLTPA
jgi:hypothetical protein